MLKNIFKPIGRSKTDGVIYKSGVTVVINIWKRNYLAEQLDFLFSQTIKPQNVWMIQYENHVSVRKILRKYPFIKYINSTENLKYFGRFSLITFFTTPYVWVLDDDIIPSTTWMETCLKACEKYNAIVCSNGLIIGEDDYPPIQSISNAKTQFIGNAVYPQPTNYCPVDTFVDYGCSSYFFKTEWVKHFWTIWPASLETGEDIHLSATCKIQADISTIIPQQLTSHNSGNLKPAYSSDEHASWIKPGFVAQRREVLRYLIDEKGWKPMLWSDTKTIHQ